MPSISTAQRREYRENAENRYRRDHDFPTMDARTHQLTGFRDGFESGFRAAERYLSSSDHSQILNYALPIDDAYTVFHILRELYGEIQTTHADDYMADGTVGQIPIFQCCNCGEESPQGDAPLGYWHADSCQARRAGLTLVSMGYMQIPTTTAPSDDD